jgi:NADH:ubiquinone reductase (H+-translocating)
VSEMAHRVLPRDFRRIDTHSARIVLIEGLDRLLPVYSEHLSAKAKQVLEGLQIQVRLGTRVTGIDDDGVMLGSERIEARTVLWGAGVAPSPLGRMLGAPVNRSGQVEVAADLTLPGDARVSVVGDLAAFTQDGKELPGLAPVAMQMGRAAARNVLRRVRGEAAKPFHYFDKGSFAVIGRGAAVGSIFSKFELSGVLAWLIWATVHLLYLVGFRSRITVMFTWLYSYLTWGRVARLITSSPWIHHWERASIAPRPPAGQATGPGALPSGVAPAPVPAHAARER